LRIYLSVPIIANRNQERAAALAKAIVDSGHQLSDPWVLTASESQSPSADNIFSRDKLGVEGSDAIVADVSQPSIGVGMEVMAAHYSKKRVIVVMRRGSVVTRMILHMTPKETVEFDGETDLYESLLRLLRGNGS
jgi:hypothetical protein